MVDRQFFIVVPPQARPPRGATLVRSANPVSEPEARWEGGLRYLPLACGDGKNMVQLAGFCSTGFSGFTPAEDRPQQVDFVPFYVAAAQECSAISGQRELEATIERAGLLLEQCDTVGIAHELWTGTKAQAVNPDLPNAYLTKAGFTDVGTGSALGALTAFAELEQGLADCSCGGVGMIHASARTVTRWQNLYLFERQPDGRLLSALGTVVVSDPGYTGEGPGVSEGDTGEAWAYATGMVDLRRGAIQRYPANGGSIGDTLNRANNDFTAFAYRAAAATFDPCCHLGAKVDLTDLT